MRGPLGENGLADDNYRTGKKEKRKKKKEKSSTDTPSLFLFPFSVFLRLSIQRSVIRQ
jgi:hypothetical protein